MAERHTAWSVFISQHSLKTTVWATANIIKTRSPQFTKFWQRPYGIGLWNRSNGKDSGPKFFFDVPEIQQTGWKPDCVSLEKFNQLLTPQRARQMTRDRAEIPHESKMSRWRQIWG